jgi:hypothetical protein
VSDLAGKGISQCDITHFTRVVEALNGTLKAAKKQKKVRVIIPSYLS